MGKLRVKLNGTDENPWHRFGLTQNPFPQIARHEVTGTVLAIQSLGGDPLKGPDDIRKRLEGWGLSPEFVEGLCERYQPGVMVEIEVSWKD